MRIKYIFAALFGVAALAIPGPAFAATTWTVCASGCNSTTIQGAVNMASAGDSVTVAAGTYDEDVTIGVPLTLLGAGSATTTISGPIGGPSSTVAVVASNVVIDGFTITRDGNDLADWNNPALNVAGVSIQGALTNLEVRNCDFVGNRNAIDDNNSSGNYFHDNKIDNNRTGFVFRNQTDNQRVIDNQITNNWTLGVVFLDGSNGSNGPVQSALNSTFSGNSISGNWYGQVVDRQTGGSLPAPGADLKNFSGNWLGSDSPVFTSANSTEPGYADQIPPLAGGTASAPGGQPDIAGPASANIDYTPFLWSGTDTSAAIGFQGDFSSLGVTSNGAQTGSAGRFQEAIGLAGTGGTVHALAGSYTENVAIPTSLTLDGAQSGQTVSGRTFGSSTESTLHGSITVQAPGVTVDGFSDTNSVPTFAAFGLVVKTAGSGAVLENNIIDTVTTADTGANGTAQGIYLENGPDNVQIVGNLINNVQSVRSAKGIAIGDSGATDPSMDVFIQGNTITGVTSTTKGAYGISLNSAAGIPTLSITGNSIGALNGGGWAHAIGVEANAPDLKIRGNTIAGINAGSSDRIAVWFESEDTSFASAHVNRNSLDVGAATGGILIDPSLGAGAIDGICNWWGSATGPSGAGSGTGAPVSTKVTYEPWLTTSSLNAACTGSTSKPTVLSVSALPSPAKTGATITLQSHATDPNGLTDVYYNLFTPGGTFVCNLAHVSVSGAPTDYTDTTVVASPLPFAGLDTGVGGPCPGAGIAEGSYVVTANWINTIGVQAGSPNNQVLANYSVTAPLVYDKTPPTITVPANMTVAATSASGAVVTYTTSATDSVGPPNPTVTCTPASGSTFPSGTTTVNCTATDTAGNVGHASFTVTVSDTARSLKQTALSQVMGLQVGAVKPDSDKLKDIANKLTDALTAANWVDGNTLVVKNGAHVFDDEKDSVHSLMDLLKDPKSTIPDATLQSIIGELDQADALLAQTAIANSTAKAPELKAANDEMAKAQDELSKGHYDTAIDHYKNAWQHATSPPGPPAPPAPPAPPGPPAPPAPPGPPGPPAPPGPPGPPPPPGH